MDVAQLINKTAFRWLRVIAKVTCADRNRIRRVIDQAKESDRSYLESEFRELKQGDGGRIPIILIIMAFLYSIKNSIVAIRTHLLFSYADAHLSFRYSLTASGEIILVHFACMTTNCTRLSTENPLIDDLSQLPMFVICDPIEVFYPVPFKYLGNIGLTLFVIFALNTLFDGILIPFLNMMYPSPNECCIFVGAPRLAILITRDRLTNIASSSPRSQLPQSLDERVELYSNLVHDRYQLSGVSPSEVSSRQLIEKLSHLTPEPHYLDLEAKFLTSGLPVTRSGWFHRKLTRITCGLLIMVNIAIFCLTYIIGIWWLGINTDARGVLFENYDRVMRLDRCSIWLTDSPSQIVNISSYDLSWNLIGTVECLVSQHIGFYIAFGTFVTFYLTILEIFYFQGEIQNQLMFLIELKRLSGETTQRCHHRTRVDGLPYRPSSSIQQQTELVVADLMMKKLQYQFKKANELSIYVMQTNLIGAQNKFFVSRLNSALAFQNLALEVLQLKLQVDPGHVHMILMERIYVKFCLYLEMMKHYERCLESIICSGYFLLFELVIVSVWHTRQLGGAIDSVTIACSLIWLTTNFVLLACSSVHTRVSALGLSKFSNQLYGRLTSFKTG